MFLLPDWILLPLEVLIWLALSLLVICRYEPRLIYYPRHPTRALERTPDQSGFQFEDVELKTSDGVKIHGWFLSGSNQHSASSGYTVLFFHGNAGNISHRLAKCRIFADLGLNILVIDYRGYGQSEGRPTEQGTYRDADAAYQYLIKRGVDADTIVVYGESLGTAVAVNLCSRVTVGALILEAPFTSIPDVAKRLFKGLPLGRLARHRYDSLSKIGRVKVPLLLLHSRQDEFFPLRYAQRLLEAASPPKQLIELQGSHADAFFESLPLVTSSLSQFLETLSHERS